MVTTLIGFSTHPDPFAAPLGVEAGFSVMLLAYAFAHAQLGYRGALRAMAPPLAVQILVLVWNRASFAWIGTELMLVGMIGLLLAGRARRPRTVRTSCGTGAENAQAYQASASLPRAG